MRKSYFILLAMAMVMACNKTQKETALIQPIKEKSELMGTAQSLFKPISSITPDEIPDKKVELGKMLYFDTRLSKDGNISCNSCHNLDTFGVDNLPTSPGDTKELGARNSPTVIYASLHTMQFWDGRAKDVEEQAEGPILNPVEHAIPSAEFLENRLRKVPEYQQLFKEVYSDQKEPITFKNVANAIAAFERKLNPSSRFDKYLEGDESALNEQEKEGLQTFVKNGCIACHSGVAVGGNLYQKFGVYGNYWEYTKSAKKDNGLYDLTKKEKDRYFFKTPGLRNVEKTSPYFHDGSVNNLEEAVKIMAKLQVNKELTDTETKNIVAFLKTLTADIDKTYKK